MAKNYEKTIRACFIGYIVQAIVNNFAPLLFITFQTTYDIPLAQITTLITINFALQLMTDLAAAYFTDKIGYRASVLIAHTMAALGLIGLAVFPSVMPSPFVGLVMAVVLYAIGGGLLEVIVSPMVEACPSEHKDRTMSMLHSFYCWGSVGVILVSTLVFWLFGIQNWRILAALWAIVPIANGIAFINVPIISMEESTGESTPMSQLFKIKMFWIFIVLMCCAGASELVISQWASAFAEKALGISKSLGDLLGPTLFAVLMGLSRVIYGKYGDKIGLDRMMILSCALCVIAYLMIALFDSAVIGLTGIAISGFAVGIMWPGTYSKAAGVMKGGGTAMFAFLALAGDLGCTSGPTFAGWTAAVFGDNLKVGILCATVFPAVMLMTLLMTRNSLAHKSQQ
ncbi:MAG: MFS transporter [Clostridia bacterium]|jgi:fucose permease|nr:MFS transporter [Clostridia bacterium]